MDHCTDYREQRITGLMSAEDLEGQNIPIQEPELGVTWEYKQINFVIPKKMYYTTGRPSLWTRVKDFWQWVGPGWLYHIRVYHKYVQELKSGDNKNS